MPTLAIIFFIFIGVFIGSIFGIFIAYKLKQWRELNDDQVLIEDVEKWMQEHETIYDN